MMPCGTRAASRAFDDQGGDASSDYPDGEIGAEHALVDEADEGG